VAAMSNILLAASLLKNRWKGLKIWSATSCRVTVMCLLRVNGIIPFHGEPALCSLSEKIIQIFSYVELPQINFTV
jgi:hypothetical protein